MCIHRRIGECVPKCIGLLPPPFSQPFFFEYVWYDFHLFIVIEDTSMSIAKDGRAIIGGHVVPPMEVRVLRALAEREEPIRAPDLTVLLSKSEGVRGEPK